MSKPPWELEWHDYYKVLGVTVRSNPAEIKSAFLTRAKLFHPDKANDDPNATLRFQILEEAFSVLSDPALRLKYDDYNIQGGHRKATQTPPTTARRPPQSTSPPPPPPTQPPPPPPPPLPNCDHPGCTRRSGQKCSACGKHACGFHLTVLTEPNGWLMPGPVCRKCLPACRDCGKDIAPYRPPAQAKREAQITGTTGERLCSQCFAKYCSHDGCREQAIATCGVCGKKVCAAHSFQPDPAAGQLQKRVCHGCITRCGKCRKPIFESTPKEFLGIEQALHRTGVKGQWCPTCLVQAPIFKCRACNREGLSLSNAKTCPECDEVGFCERCIPTPTSICKTCGAARNLENAGDAVRQGGACLAGLTILVPPIALLIYFGFFERAFENGFFMGMMLTAIVVGILYALWYGPAILISMFFISICESSRGIFINQSERVKEKAKRR